MWKNDPVTQALDPANGWGRALIALEVGSAAKLQLREKRLKEFLFNGGRSEFV